MELATASFSNAHPMLSQSSGPVGIHTPYGEDRFPRIDEEGTCWVPVGLDESNANDPNQWIDYDDPESQIKRDDCADFPFNDICANPLSWNTIACEQDEVGPGADGEDGEEEDGDLIPGLPLIIVLPVQLAEVIWKLHIVGMITLPWWLILQTVNLIDFFLDIVWLVTFFWAKPIAGLFIWLTNLAMLPFHILGWLMRFRLELYAFVVDGWMFVLGGSGCFLSFGKHCWFNKPFWERSVRRQWDIPLLWQNNDYIQSIINPQPLETVADVRRVQAANHEIFYELMGYAMPKLFKNMNIFDL